MTSRWSHRPDQNVGSKQPKSDKNSTWTPPPDPRKKGSRSSGGKKGR